MKINMPGVAVVVTAIGLMSLVLAITSLAGCDKPSKTTEALEKTESAMDKAAEKTEAAAKKAAAATEDAAERAARKTGEALEKAGTAMEQTGAEMPQ